jgi:hypothetical protein
MAITSAAVLTVAPELSSLTSGQWSALITSAYLQMDAGTWGTWLDMGATYLVAHLGTLTKRAGVGAVISERVGDVGRTYAELGSGVLDSTTYGAEYQRLTRLLGDARGPVVI